MGNDTTHFFDAHTHVQFSAYNDDRDDVMRRALASDVWMMNVGTQRDTSKAAVELAGQYEGAFAAVALHPVHTSRSFHDAQELGGGESAHPFTSRGEVFDVAYYRDLAKHPKVLAIGECGLDYFHFNDDEPESAQIERQKSAFLAHIELAKEIKKPLMIHCRNAFNDVLEMVAPHVSDLKPGIIHFFTGTPEDARRFLDFGFSFTFGGVVTFPPRKGRAEGDYDETIRQIPIDRILSETDAPYVAPALYRGKRNEPMYVIETVKRLAALKNVSLEEMKEQIWKNAKRILGI